jgi:integrase/recombinase XerD
MYRVFCQRVGDVRMNGLSASDLVAYLEHFQNCSSAWQLRFRLLQRFLDFWIVRGELLPLPMPPRQVRTSSRFLPYVFTHSQLRVLIAGATSSQSTASCKISGRTLQTLLIVACAIGARPEELRGIKKQDLQLGRKLLLIRGVRSGKTRSLPIGPELCELLASFSQWRFGSTSTNGYFFATKQQKILSPTQVSFAFSRLCINAGVERQDGFTQNPRLIDMRNTFAVHRIDAWIKEGLDLDRMLPSLAAYMGLDQLPSADRYLRMTPERFRVPLTLLSPRKGKIHWRDDPKLVPFFATLHLRQVQSARLPSRSPQQATRP